MRGTQNIHKYMTTPLSKRPVVVAVVAITAAALLLGASNPGATSRIINDDMGGNDFPPLARVRIQLVELGGCQYVVCQSFGSGATVTVIHHAACRNPLHAAHE